MDQFQYIKLPDGSYGKFAADASDATIRSAVEKDFPAAFNAKVGQTPVPQGLQGSNPGDDQYKPFFSGDEARDEGMGLIKSSAGTVAALGRGLSHVPVIGKGVIDPQKVSDMEDFARANNHGETFGKVAGAAVQALPAIATGGEFAGGIADELYANAPKIAEAAQPLMGALGRVGKVAGKATVGAGMLGAGYDVEKAIIDKLKSLF